MTKLKRMLTCLVILATVGLSSTIRLDAVTYVTDTGGFAYDESRAATNLAPAIALGTVALVAVIALAVQNSHDHSSSSSSSHAHSGSASSSFSSGSSSSSSN
ncbi:MAG: hypothetical protein H0W88_01070 [Parachlamydiaceae bacterium]|nr:hypothetical protein [Parachlamydiaceae bacterium]